MKDRDIRDLQQQFAKLETEHQARMVNHFRRQRRMKWLLALVTAAVFFAPIIAEWLR